MKIEKVMEDGVEYTVVTDMICIKWFLQGRRHREHGPAIIGPAGALEWYRHGKHHRLDGPAIIHASGDQYWWYDGAYINVTSQHQFDQWLKLRVFE